MRCGVYITHYTALWDLHAVKRMWQRRVMEPSAKCNIVFPKMVSSVYSSEAGYKESDTSGTLLCVMCNLLRPLFIYVHVAVYNVNKITRTSLVLQGTFLPLVVPPNSQQIILWSTWLVLLCSLKVLCAITSTC